MMTMILSIESSLNFVGENECAINLSIEEKKFSCKNFNDTKKMFTEI